MKTVVIVITQDQQLVNGIIGLVTGQDQAALAGVLHQTTAALHQAEAINTDPPKP